jgi:FtsP/CotA-like multicopper oxidase with cupredoxin domain
MWLVAALALAGATCIQAVPAQAQWITCAPENQDLVRVPELISQGGRLRGTIILSDEQERLTFRQPPGDQPGTGRIQCAPQYLRTFRGVDAVPPPPSTPAGGYPDPLPGPTLRARVGDIVELTFLNQINPSDFGNSIDLGERNTGSGCDESSAGYPGSAPGPKNGPPGDTFPNCFHGSSTGNIHFHGTHTNPNGTGDNVFIEVRPSPRVNGQPTVTEASVREPFDRFFAECEKRLRANILAEWPTTWLDAPLGPYTDPKTWTAEQARLLKQYDTNPDIGKKLWPINEAQIKVGEWPQYYIGAVPYCFQLPAYTGGWPPVPPPNHPGMPWGQNGVLQMGQSPGTHWYHAHKHGSTAINVSNGMTGVFIIEGKYDDDLNAFYGKDWTRTQPVMVINQLGVTPNLERNGPGRTDKGADFSINGRLRPIVRMKPGEVQMWRIANTSSRAGVYLAGPPTGFAWRQLAQDGVQFDDGNYLRSENTSLLLAAGNRADLLIQAPTQAGTYQLMTKNVVTASEITGSNPQPNILLLTVEVAGTGPSMQFIKRAPTFPSFLADIADWEVRGTKTITFATAPFGHHTIDDKQFDGTTGPVVRLNTVEEWKIENATISPAIDHPFHIHINPFQVTEVFSPNETIVDPKTGKPVPKYVFDQASYVAPNQQCLLDLNKKDTW